MCCFSRTVTHVSQTRIFARATDGANQVLVYSMSLSVDEDLAMVLPLPTPPRPREDAVRFIDLHRYPDFFADLEKGFPPPPRYTGPFAPAALFSGAPPTLKVHKVGDFEASFVPQRDDFARLDARFRIPEQLFTAVPAYQDWSFAVFKLGAARSAVRTIHPMAFAFPRRNPGQLFFPTVHLHEGSVPARAQFDHTLYCQTDDPLLAGTLPWRRSEQPARQFVDAKRARDVIQADAPCYRSAVRGESANVDITLTPPQCRLDSLECAGELYHVRLGVAANYYWSPEAPDAKAWQGSARTGLDQLSAALSAALHELTTRKRTEWGLVRYRDDLPQGYLTPPPPIFNVPVPGPGQPCRFTFSISNRRVEQQQIHLGFATTPTQAQHDAIRAELAHLLDRVTG